jgi:hypothetical protein
MIGLVLVLGGCNTDQSFVDTTGPLPTPGSSTSSGASETATSSVNQSGPLGALQEQLRAARKKLEAQYTADPSYSQGCFKPPFVLAAPDLNGYVVDSVDAPDMGIMGVTVTVRLTDQADSRRWLELYDQMGCYGVLPYAPPGATNVVDWHHITIAGCSTFPPSQSITWTLPDGSNEMFLAPGCGPPYSPDVLAGFLLKGHNLDQDTLFRVFSSLQPVSE